MKKFLFASLAFGVLAVGATTSAAASEGKAFPRE